MKILHICTGFYESSVYMQLLEKLDQLCYNIVFVPLTNISSKNERILTFAYRRIRGFYWYDIMIRYKQLIRKVEISKFDLLHTHFLFFDGDVACKLNKSLNIPYIVTCRNTDDYIFRYRKYLKKRGIRILENATKIIFLSPTYQATFLTCHTPKNLKEAFLNKSLIIPNGIDPFWHNNKNEPKLYKNEQTIRLLTVGEICKNKNQISVAQAVELLIKDGFDVVYTVVGKVIDNSVYKQLMKFNFIKYFENQPMESLIEIYRESDIFILVSLRESFGLVYAEAMSQGLPVIYSEGQGFDGQFEEGFIGFHAKASSPKNIKDVIIDTSKKYEMISTNCLRSFKSFDWDNIALKYKEVYQSTVQEGIK